MKKTTHFSILFYDNPYDLIFRVEDVPIVFEVLMDEVYYVPKPWICDDACIVDLGAHIGLSCLYFHSMHNISTYLAVEPSSDSYEMMLHNTSKFKILPINKAIFNSNQPVLINKNDFLSHNHQISELKGTLVPTITMDQLITDANIKKITINRLKFKF